MNSSLPLPITAWATPKHSSKRRYSWTGFYRAALFASRATVEKSRLPILTTNHRWTFANVPVLSARSRTFNSYLSILALDSRLCRVVDSHSLRIACYSQERDSSTSTYHFLDMGTLWPTFETNERLTNRVLSTALSASPASDHTDSFWAPRRNELPTTSCALNFTVIATLPTLFIVVQPDRCQLGTR